MDASAVLLKKLKAAKIRPSQLARAIGVSPQMAGMVLKGQRGISTWHLDAVAALLDVQLAELFTDSDQLRHDSKTGSTLPGRSSDDAAPTRVLKETIDAYEAFVRAVADVARNLGTLAQGQADRLKTGTLGDSAAHRRRRR